MGVGRPLAVVVVVAVMMVVMPVMVVGMTVFMIVIPMMMVMAVGMTVPMVVIMMMVVIMGVPHVLPLDTGLALAATAYGTHQSTSSSLIRSSSPPVICN
jgi:hypothetical protein